MTLEEIEKPLPLLEERGPEYIKRLAGFDGEITDYKKAVHAELFRANLIHSDLFLRDRLDCDQGYIYDTPPWIDKNDMYYWYEISQLPYIYANKELYSPITGTRIVIDMTDDATLSLAGPLQDFITVLKLSDGSAGSYKAISDQAKIETLPGPIELAQQAKKAYIAMFETAEEIVRNMGHISEKDPKSAYFYLVECRKIEAEPVQDDDQNTDNMTEEELESYRLTRKMEKSRRENPTPTALEEILAAFLALKLQPVHRLTWKGTEDEIQELEEFIKFVLTTYADEMEDFYKYGILGPLLVKSSGNKFPGLSVAVDATAKVGMGLEKPGTILVKTIRGKDYREKFFIQEQDRPDKFTWLVLCIVNDFLFYENTEMSVYEIAQKMNKTDRKPSAEESRKVLTSLRFLLRAPYFYRSYDGSTIQERTLLEGHIEHRQAPNGKLTPYLILPYRPRRRLPVFKPAYTRKGEYGNVYTMDEVFYKGSFLPDFKTEEELAISFKLACMAGNANNQRTEYYTDAGTDLTRFLGYDQKGETARKQRQRLLKRLKQRAKQWTLNYAFKGYLIEPVTGKVKVSSWTPSTKGATMAADQVAAAKRLEAGQPLDQFPDLKDDKNLDQPFEHKLPEHIQKAREEKKLARQKKAKKGVKNKT